MTYPAITPQFSKYSEWTTDDVQQLADHALNDNLPPKEQALFLNLLIEYQVALGLELQAGLAKMSEQQKKNKKNEKKSAKTQSYITSITYVYNYKSDT